MTQCPDRPNAPPPVRILVLDLLMSAAADLPAGLVTTAGFADLGAAILARVKPDHIILPLLSAGDDAFSVIERLQTLGYGGLITVVARPLPNAGMVEAELRALGPGHRLALLIANG